jgi:hypothetical protein
MTFTSHAPQNRNSSLLITNFGNMSYKNSISYAILRPKMESVPRFFIPPADHIFLLGPRGTDKTWLTQRLFPQALRIDLLEPETLCSLSARLERRLRELIWAMPQEDLLLLLEHQRIALYSALGWKGIFQRIEAIYLNVLARCH